MEPHSHCKKTGEETVRGEMEREWRPRQASDTVFYQQVKASRCPPEATTTNPPDIGGEGSAAE